jgi:sulfite exporter TauE/SafE/copper chaperone CopZ
LAKSKKRKQRSTLELRIERMTCVNCQDRIERALKRIDGVTWTGVSYSEGKARVEYDARKTGEGEIVAAIEKLGYGVARGKKKGKERHVNGAVSSSRGLDARRVAGVLVAVVAAFLIMRGLGFTTSFGAIPLAEEGMGYGLLFVIGLLTSVHCVAMCGGINISQCIPAAAAGSPDKKRNAATLAPSLKYNLARVCSYTAVGAAVGGIGSVVSLSGDAKGIIQLIAGVFMVIMGLSMFGVLPGISRITPRLPRVFGEKVAAAKESSAGDGSGKGPIVVGLLNGLMPCGPLQAMQIFALSTGSPAQGALSMLCFSLGTMPLMFGLGALSSALGRKFTSRAMTIGAALVIFLGLFMFTQGLTLSGVNVDAPTRGGGGDGYIAADTDDEASDDAYTDEGGNSYSVVDGVQVVRSELTPRDYPHITVKAGTPVHWIIDAPARAITGCNGAIYIPEYNIEYAFEPGENVIDFTPEKPGEFMYSCWMGMITSYITVEA